MKKIITVLLLGILMISCTTVTRTVVVRPPSYTRVVMRPVLPPPVYVYKPRPSVIIVR